MEQKGDFREIPFDKLDPTKGYIIVPNNGSWKCFQMSPITAEQAVNYLKFINHTDEGRHL